MANTIFQMSGEKHLKYFCVENFKRYKRFELNDIGQFNLIGGDNNVGKTTLLEALLIDEDDLKKSIYNWDYALRMRNVNIRVDADPSWIMKFYQSFKISESPNTFILKFKDSIENIYTFNPRAIESLTPAQVASIETAIKINSRSKEVLEITSNGEKSFEFLSEEDHYVPFVSVNTGYDLDLIDFYSQQIQSSLSEEQDLIDDLRSFIPNVIGLGISNTVVSDKQSTIIVRLKGEDKPLPLPMFGEGAIKMFRILVEIAICKGKRLMIDEIDTGIHHSRFKLFWRTIIKAAKKKNVQIFATTHNHECLRFLKEALEERDMAAMQDDTKYYLLHQIDDKEIKASGYNFSQFQFAIDHDNEIRS